MVHVSPDWEISVPKCHSGIQIMASTVYDSHDGITYIQFPNVIRLPLDL